jgi:16S rRNA (cytidine1402-2'-O)-methyltransferase
MLGTLYLIPVTLGDDNVAPVLPDYVLNITRQLSTFVVENEKTARRFLLSKPKSLCANWNY